MKEEKKPKKVTIGNLKELQKTWHRTKKTKANYYKKKSALEKKKEKTEYV